MSIATPVFFFFFFWSPFAWSMFFQPFTFSLYVSLVSRWVSFRQHIKGSCFCIHPVSLCLLVGTFNPFMFKVIIDKYDPIAIFFIVLGSSLYTFLCFLSREDPLAFVEELVWWCWIFLAFACLWNFWFLLTIGMRFSRDRVILTVAFSFSAP